MYSPRYHGNVIRKKTTRKKTTAKRKTTKKTEAVEVIIPEEVEEKRVGSDLTPADQIKGSAMSASIRTLQAGVKKLVEAGKIDKLTQTALENWAVMLVSDNENQRAFATERISRYLFAPKKEVIGIPVININCNFIGIKDAKK